MHWSAYLRAHGTLHPRDLELDGDDAVTRDTLTRLDIAVRWVAEWAGQPFLGQELGGWMSRALNMDLLLAFQATESPAFGLVAGDYGHFDAQGRVVGSQYTWMALHESFDNRTEILMAG